MTTRSILASLRATAMAATAVTCLAASLACTTASQPTRGPARDRPRLGSLVDRAGRALTGNALVGLLAPEAVADRRKEEYNRAAPADWLGFAADIERSLAVYDGLDGTCGDQWRMGPPGEPARYRALAVALADDRLWVDSRFATCSRYLAVELAGDDSPGDCGGRTPVDDTVDVFRSLLVGGTVDRVNDGVAHDDRRHSTDRFPFLAAP